MDEPWKCHCVLYHTVGRIQPTCGVRLDVLQELCSFHMICRCTRWHAAKIIQTREEAELMDALLTVWRSVHGPPEFFYIDGKLGLNTDEARPHIKRQGSISKLRAPQQHARFIERRGAVLRVSMHTTEDQCVREAPQISIHMLLALGVFAGNDPPLSAPERLTRQCTAGSHSCCLHLKEKQYTQATATKDVLKPVCEKYQSPQRCGHHQWQECHER